jgi:hypothetical protein
MDISSFDGIDKFWFNFPFRRYGLGLRRRILRKGNRKVYLVSGLVFLVTFFYQFQGPSSHYHREGVIHNNQFEYSSQVNYGKNYRALILCLPFNSSYDPLTQRIKSYTLIYPVEKIGIQLFYCYSIVHKSRDDLVNSS